MLTQIKSLTYSSLLFCGSLYFKDRSSKVVYYHDIHVSEDNKFTDMSTPFSLFKKHINIS